MTPEVDSRRYGTTNPKRSGHEHVRRQVRRALAKTAGQIENNGCGNVQKDRYSKDNIVELGIGTSGTTSKSLSHSCRIIRNPSKNSLAGSLIAQFPKMGLPPIAIPRNGVIIPHVTLGDSGFRFPESIETETSQYCPPNVTTWSNAGSFRFRKACWGRHVWGRGFFVASSVFVFVFCLPVFFYSGGTACLRRFFRWW